MQTVLFLARVALIGLVIACAPTPLPPTNAAATDLRFVAETVRQTHPALNGGPSRQAFDLLARALENSTGESSTPAEVYALTARLLSSVHDGHTLIVPAQSKINLPLKFRWLVDGLVVTQASATSGISAGDEVIRLGTLTTTELLERLRILIPAENDGHIRALGALLLPNATLLEAVGVLDNGSAALELRNADGQSITTSIKLSSERLTTTEGGKYGWLLEPQYGLFWLDTCDDTPEFRRALLQLFTAVKKANLHRVAIDVRHNSGGDSRVLDALLEYLPADSVRGFHRPENDGVFKVSHPIPELIFQGELFVLTGPFTFSSANWIAGTIHDNRLGLTVGETTGNAPTSFGNVKAFSTPNFKLRFQVSQTLWLRPNMAFDPTAGLEPDVLIPTTVRDVQRGHDPVLTWLTGPSSSVMRAGR
jgi:Peptidase family S41